MSAAPKKSEDRGVIAWMVKNRVTPNLIMIFLLAFGLCYDFGQNHLVYGICPFLPQSCPIQSD